MKAVFPLTEWSMGHRSDCWFRHLAVCLNSIAANTHLDPRIIWRGSLDHPVAKLLSRAIPVLPSLRPFDASLSAPEFVPQRPVEVSYSTLLKLEAACHLFRRPQFEDRHAVVADIDTFWLRDPGQDAPEVIAAGPQMYPGDARLNAGVTVINVKRMLDLDIVGMAQNLIRTTNTGSDEYILNKLFCSQGESSFGQWELIDWEQRAFWPMPKKLPAVVHFHGPKLDQIESLGRGLCSVGKADAEIARLYVNGRNSLHAWAEMALPYLNSPYPWYEQLIKASCPLR